MSKQFESLRIDDSIWGVQNILEPDHEMDEFQKNFPEGAQADSVLVPDELNVYPSIINFSQQEIQLLNANDDEDEVMENDDFFEDRESYRDANQDGVYYLI